MKIYPGTHNVKIKKQVNLGDIPLSYLQGNEQSKNVTIHIAEPFIHPTTEENVRPYQVFDSADVTFFDDKHTTISDATPYLVKRGSQYYAKPANVISESAIHTSEQFLYSILLQKQDTYKKSLRYNIQCAAADMDIAEALSKFCCNNEEKKLYPSNIQFNDGTRLIQDFFTQSTVGADFFFVTLDALETLARDAEITLQEQIARYLEQHVNVWILDDSFGHTYIPVDGLEDTTYQIDTPQIFTSVLGTTSADQDGSYGRFYTNERWSLISDEEEDYLPFFSIGGPVQIIRKHEQGYAVLSHPDIIFNGAQNIKLILEVLMYIYLNTYYQTNTRSSFVTDDPIDYFIHVNKKYGLCHPKINLLHILNQERFNTSLQYQILNVIIDQNAVFTGITRFHDLRFRKVSPRLNEHSKGNNILAYTSSKTLLLYYKDAPSLRLIESDVTVRDNKNGTITLEPVLSSRYGIALHTEKTFTVPSLTGEYVIAYHDNTFTLRFKNGTPDTYVILAYISVADNMDIVYKDIRTPGGGEWSTEPNYEMIDTGHLMGRPLRYGGLLLIQMPLRLKPIENELKAEIEKHMTSGDYPILIFKD